MIEKYTKKITVKLKQEMCSICKKKTPEYFELVIQIRFIFFNEYENIVKTIESIITKFENFINKKKEITSIKKKFVGFDLYFNNSNLKEQFLKIIEKRFFINKESSKKIITRDKQKSKDIYKEYLLIEIINIEKEKNYFICGEEKLLKNFSRKDKTLTFLNLKTKQKQVLKYKTIRENLTQKFIETIKN